MFHHTKVYEELKHLELEDQCKSLLVSTNFPINIGTVWAVLTFYVMY